MGVPMLDGGGGVGVGRYCGRGFGRGRVGGYFDRWCAGALHSRLRLGDKVLKQELEEGGGGRDGESDGSANNHTNMRGGVGATISRKSFISHVIWHVDSCVDQSHQHFLENGEVILHIPAMEVRLGREYHPSELHPPPLDSTSTPTSTHSLHPVVTHHTHITSSAAAILWHTQPQP